MCLTSSFGFLATDTLLCVLINLVEISKVVLEIQMAEFGNFTVPVNNTLVCLASSFGFLAVDTLLCVLIYIHSYYSLYVLLINVCQIYT